jgi:rhamnogalacturonan hydrolase
MMIKSNGGSGYLRNVVFQDFISTGSAYGLNVNQYWSSMSTIAGNGVALSDILFKVKTNDYASLITFNNLRRTGTAK